MILIVSKYLIPKSYSAFTVFPFVFLCTKEAKHDRVLLNHERIHLRQQAELLVVPFFIGYGIEFLWRWCQTRNKTLAYRNISFEKEAYQNETNFTYLKQRPFFNFRRYGDNN